jgi:hypothetical protein
VPTVVAPELKSASVRRVCRAACAATTGRMRGTEFQSGVQAAVQEPGALRSMLPIPYCGSSSFESCRSPILRCLPLVFLAHLARAAFRAFSWRCSYVSFSADAFPPLRPSATAAGFFFFAIRGTLEQHR